MKVALVLGTRPEIIKMAPVAKELDRRGVDYFIVHTGQHYDFNMDKIFFDEFGLRSRMINLDVGSGTHAETTAKIMVETEKLFKHEKPTVVLVQGDTNTALAAALVSSKIHIPIGHIEAGLRSNDRRMPEEYNRIICDHVAHYLFAPTELAVRNLQSEGIPKKNILFYDKTSSTEVILTGNTVVDAIKENINKADESEIFQKLGIERNNYFLFTTHRQENVDSKENLLGILEGLESVCDEHQMPAVYPIHPRTRKRLDEFGLMEKLLGIKGIKVIDPVGFFDLLALESNARLILTDSGGIQEEACSLKIPCVVLRDRSDRPESVEAGAAILAGCDAENISAAARKMLMKGKNWDNPFGDGSASEQIVDYIIKKSGNIIQG